MKTKTTYLILFFLSHLAIAQNFSKTYDGNIQLFTDFIGVESTSTNYKITLSTAEVINGQSIMQIRHITSNFDGSINNIKRYSPTDSNFSLIYKGIVTLPDDSQIIYGEYLSNDNSTAPIPFMISINNDGSINWAKKINTTRESLSLHLLSDNTIFARFQFREGSITRTIFAKLDTNGNLSSFKELNLQFNPVNKVVPNNDGTFDVLLSRGDLLNINNDLSTVNWQRKYYHETAINFTKTLNGDYVFMSSQATFGHSTIFRTDPSGNLLWAKYIETFIGAGSSPYLTLGAHFITEDNSTGNIVVNVRNAASFASLIITLDANGNYISNRKADTSNNHIKLLNNNEYIVGSIINGTGDQDFAFEKRNFTTEYGCDVTLTHTITNGNEMALAIDPATLTTIQDFTTEDIGVNINDDTLPVSETEFCDMFLSVNEEQLIENELNIFPNPTSNIVWIKTNKKINNISIYNYLGQFIEKSNQTSIDMSNYANGIYFFKIKLNDTVITKKIIKQ